MRQRLDGCATQEKNKDKYMVQSAEFIFLYKPAFEFERENNNKNNVYNSI